MKLSRDRFACLALQLAATAMTIAFYSGCSSPPQGATLRHGAADALNVAQVHIDEYSRAMLFTAWSDRKPTVRSTISVFGLRDDVPDQYLFLLDCDGRFCGDILVDVLVSPPAVVESSASTADIWGRLTDGRRVYRLGGHMFYVRVNSDGSSQDVLTTMPPYETSLAEFEELLSSYRKINAGGQTTLPRNESAKTTSERPLSARPTDESNRLPGKLQQSAGCENSPVPCYTQTPYPNEICSVGCTPTAFAMAYGYFDQNGHDGLILGDASRQTTVVNEAMVELNGYLETTCRHGQGETAPSSLGAASRYPSWLGRNYCNFGVEVHRLNPLVPRFETIDDYMDTIVAALDSGYPVIINYQADFGLIRGEHIVGGHSIVVFGYSGDHTRLYANTGQPPDLYPAVGTWVVSPGDIVESIVIVKPDSASGRCWGGDGELIQGGRTGSVFYVKNRQRLQIRPSDLHALGFEDGRIVHVAPNFLGNYTVGPDVGFVAGFPPSIFFSPAEHRYFEIVDDRTRVGFWGDWDDSDFLRSTGFHIIGSVFADTAGVLGTRYQLAVLPSGHWPPIDSAPQPVFPVAGSSLVPGQISFRWAPSDDAYRYGLEVCRATDGRCGGESAGCIGRRQSSLDSFLEIEPPGQTYETLTVQEKGEWCWRASAIGNDSEVPDLQWTHGQWARFRVETSPATGVTPDVPCPNGDGAYCGNGVDGHALGNLYNCVNGNWSFLRACPNGCDQQSAGSNDGCRSPLPGDHDTDQDGWSDRQYGGGDCNDSNQAVNPGAMEHCDGLDENCNGQIDENVVQQCDTLLTGACRRGQQRCFAGIWEPCAPLVAAPELCGNDVDDNCNGEIDEHCGVCNPGLTSDCFTGPPQALGRGDCRRGVETCGPDGRWGPCVGEVLPAAEVACNGRDEDCDGSDDPCPPFDDELPACRTVERPLGANCYPGCYSEQLDRACFRCGNDGHFHDESLIPVPRDQPCVTFLCDEFVGILPVHREDGTTCDDSDPSTTDDRCDRGQCVGRPDGQEFECVDGDSDGFGTWCPSGDDCNDADPTVNPAAIERCNDVDDNCNNVADEECSHCEGQPDGVLVEGPWDECHDFEGDCGNDGRRTRVNTVCRDGSSSEEPETEGCQRDTDGRQCGTDGTCRAGLCDSPVPIEPPASVQETVERLKNCVSALPTTTRVFTTSAAMNYEFDMNTFANSACFIADTAVAPTSEPARSEFRRAFEAANPSAVLGRHSAFTEVPIDVAEAQNLPDEAFVRCTDNGRRITSWYGLNYLISPITPAGRDAILELTGRASQEAVHPILYVDSLLPWLWYYCDFNRDCDNDGDGECNFDIDGDGTKDRLNDPRWRRSQIDALDMVRSAYNVGLVGHVTEAANACEFAPHLDGVDTELGGYVIDGIWSTSDLEVWDQGTRRCFEGQACYRAVFTGANPALDALLAPHPPEQPLFPWERDDLFADGGIIDRMRADTNRISTGHLLAALTGAAANPGTTQTWGTGPFPSRWIDPAGGRPVGWLGGPISRWKTVQSESGGALSAREFDHGLILWNGGDSDQSALVSGWNGSTLNSQESGAGAEDVPVGRIFFRGRSGVVLKRGPEAPFALPPEWEDPRIRPAQIVPADYEAPLRVRLFFEPDPQKVAQVLEFAGWTNGFDYSSWDQHCDLDGPGPAQCDALNGCIVSVLEANATLRLYGEAELGYSCYSDPPGSGQFRMNGTAFVETNHGQRVELQCGPCDPAHQDPLWCGNMKMPQGVILK